MTSPSLTLGSALLAFSPSLSLLLFLVLPKPQLLILAIGSAFAYLTSALFSSAVWWLLRFIFGNSDVDASSSWGSLLILVLPSVICQYVVRCYFVKTYFKVEKVIQKSVAKHQAETESDESEEDHDDQQHNETNALQLQLNDLSCSLASGTGYALFHSLFLYGTLLASESNEQYTTGKDRDGTLYQPSCPFPSLIHGALICGMFSILDVIWMMCTFYGMRRRTLYSNENGGSRIHLFLEGLSFWKGLPDSLEGGHAALGLVLLSHLGASLVLAPNMQEGGCQLSLPLLGLVVVLVGILFVRGVRGHYLPEDQRRRIEGLGEEERVNHNDHHVD